MNQDSTFRHQYDYMVKKPSAISRFLWWCAGADTFYLCQSPMQDRVKYAGIGGIVLCTGVLAAFSGGFAFNTIFGPKVDALDTGLITTAMDIIGSVIFGICWGLVIFNLDRFIVSSTGKGDGTDTITPTEWGQAAPRIIIAAILGLAISTPLEIKILQTEIEAELKKYQEKHTQELNEETLAIFTQKKAQLETRKAEFEGKIAAYEAELKVYDDEIDALVAVLQNEMSGNRGGGYGYGPVAKKLDADIATKRAEKEAFIQRKSAEIQGYYSQLGEVNGTLNDLEKELLEEQNKNKEEGKKYDGLLKRIQISHEIGGWIPKIIFLVFLCIEMGPIIFKMMMTKGVYDYLVENNNYRLKTENGVFKEEYVYEGKDGIMHMEKWRFLDAELTKHEKSLKIEHQKKINEEVIAQWGAKKLEQVKANPDAFYTEGEESRQSNPS